MAGRPTDENVGHLVQQHALECGVGVRRNAGREDDDEAVVGTGKAGNPGRDGAGQLFALLDEDDAQWRARLFEPHETRHREQPIGLDCLEAGHQMGERR